MHPELPSHALSANVSRKHQSFRWSRETIYLLGLRADADDGKCEAQWHIESIGILDGGIVGKPERIAKERGAYANESRKTPVGSICPT
jgi:hypothetical protein